MKSLVVFAVEVLACTIVGITAAVAGDGFSIDITSNQLWARVHSEKSGILNEALTYSQNSTIGKLLIKIDPTRSPAGYYLDIVLAPGDSVVTTNSPMTYTQLTFSGTRANILYDGMGVFQKNNPGSIKSPARGQFGPDFQGAKIYCIKADQINARCTFTVSN